jgi:hypothetical protein
MHGIGWGRRFATELALDIAKEGKPMQRAGQKRPVSVGEFSCTPPISQAAVTLRLMADKSPPVEGSTTKVGEIVAVRGAKHEELEVVIRKRIESRLAGRVRNLLVRANGDSVVLEGQCATFYTKQIAQHAAMGVLDDQHLENAIVVSPVQT